MPAPYGAPWSPLSEDPDDVQPGDLAPSQRPDLKLNNDPLAMQARRYESIDPEARDKFRAPLAPPADDAAQPQDGAGEAAPVAAPEPPPAKPRGGGGSGGGGLPKQELGISQGEKDALQQQRDADKAALGTADESKTNAVNKANADQALAEAEADAHQKFDQHAQQVRDQATSYLRQKQEEASKYEIKDFFADKPESTRVMAALWTGLGAFASAFTGGPNQALDIINNAIDRDHKLKLEHAEKLQKQVGEARLNMKDADAELSAQEAGMLRKLADDRAVRMKKFGATDAQIAGDEVRNKILAESSAREVKAQQGIEDRIEGQRKLYVQETVGRSEAAKNYADAAKLKAEAGSGTAGQGKAATKMIEMANYGSQMRKDINELRPLMKEITPEVLAKVQQNEKEMQTMEKAGPLAASLGRGSTLYARDRYQGLTEPQKRAVYLHDVINQKAAAVLAGQGHENHKDMANILGFTPSDTAAGLNGKLEQYDDLAATAMALGGQYSQKAIQAKDDQRAAVAAQRPSGVPDGAVPVKVRDKKSGQVIDAWKLPNGRLAAMQ